MIFYIKFYDLFANCSNSIQSFELSKVQYLKFCDLAPMMVFKICDNLLDFEKKDRVCSERVYSKKLSNE